MCVWIILYVSMSLFVGVMFLKTSVEMETRFIEAWLLMRTCELLSEHKDLLTHLLTTET